MAASGLQGQFVIIAALPPKATAFVSPLPGESGEIFSSFYKAFEKIVIPPGGLVLSVKRIEDRHRVSTLADWSVAFERF
jgi:hypothetical protein